MRRRASSYAPSDWVQYIRRAHRKPILRPSWECHSHSFPKPHIESLVTFNAAVVNFHGQTETLLAGDIAAATEHSSIAISIEPESTLKL
jgi:predicted GH43/DUF377 family glycosyl hydrolase